MSQDRFHTDDDSTQTPTPHASGGRKPLPGDRQPHAMSELLDAAAALVLATALLLVGLAMGPESGLVVGGAGGAAALYVGARVGTLRRRVEELEARLGESD